LVSSSRQVRGDLEEMELPLLQMRRYLAAVAILPAPPELPGRLLTLTLTLTLALTLTPTLIPTLTLTLTQP